MTCRNMMDNQNSAKKRRKKPYCFKVLTLSTNCRMLSKGRLLKALIVSPKEALKTHTYVLRSVLNKPKEEIMDTKKDSVQKQKEGKKWNKGNLAQTEEQDGRVPNISTVTFTVII